MSLLAHFPCNFWLNLEKQPIAGSSLIQDCCRERGNSYWIFVGLGEKMSENLKFKARHSVINNVMVTRNMSSTYNEIINDRQTCETPHAGHDILGGGPAFIDYADHSFIIAVNFDAFPFPQMPLNKTNHKNWIQFKENRGAVALQKLLRPGAGKPLTFVLTPKADSQCCIGKKYHVISLLKNFIIKKRDAIPVIQKKRPKLQI